MPETLLVQSTNYWKTQMIVFKVIRKMAYAGTYIYVMRYPKGMFQYMFCFSEGGDLHQDYVIVPAPLYRHFLVWVGLLDDVYTQGMIEEAEQILLSGAMKSLEELVSRKDQLARDSAK